MSKTKLTLSVEEATIRRAKAAGKRSGKTMSQLFTEAMERSSSKPDRKSWSAKWGGKLKFEPSDLERDDLVGRVARKMKVVRKAKRA